MHESARRLEGGRYLREAMAEAGLGLVSLAHRTKLADPAGKGVSFQLIGFLATTQPWARETTTPHTARLIEDALSVPRGTLFQTVLLEPQPGWAAL